MAADASVHPHATFPELPMGPNVPVPSKRKDTIWLSSPLDIGKIWVLIWPMMSPDVVTCITITRPLWSGNPLPAVFNTYHAEPMNDVAARPVAPLVWKKGEIGWLGSSARAGSIASGMSDVCSGSVRPIVPNVSSANSG